MKVICSGVWDSSYVNRDGVTVNTVNARFSVPLKSGMYEYPYGFQLPADSVRPDVLKTYEVDFSFGFYLRSVEKADDTGELSVIRERVPTWRVGSISESK